MNRNQKYQELKDKAQELKGKVIGIVEQTYPNDFKFIRTLLTNQIIKESEAQLTQAKSMDDRLSKIQEQIDTLQTTLWTQYQKVKEQYKQYIAIATDTLAQNQDQIRQQYCCQFSYYRNIVTQRLKLIEASYYQNIEFEQNGARFKDHCKYVFDELLTKDIENLETFKQYAQNAYVYVTDKFKSLKMRLNEDQSINWVEEEKKIFAKLYNGWTQGMEDNQIDELIDLKSYEQRKPQIKQVDLPEEIPEKVKDIGEELRQQVQVLVETNYIQEFKFIRTLLKEKIFYDMQQVPEFLNLLQNDMQQAVQSYYKMIFQFYRIYREAAFEIYNFNKNQIMQQQCSWFTYYQKVGKRLEWSWSQYIEQVSFIQEVDQFNVQCQALFNKLFNEPIEGQPKINLEEFNQNTSQAMTYVTNQYNSMQQKIRDQYENDATLVNWGQIQNQVLGKLYQGWKPRMEEYEIQQLLQIKEQEKQILSEIKFNQIVKAFIEMAGKNGHYYLFDEEYQMINQNAKIQEIQVQSSSPDILAREYYKEILETLKINEQIQVLKNTLIDAFSVLNLIPINLSSSFKRQVINQYFNYIRNSVFQSIGYCSFQWFKGQYTQDQELVNALVGCLPRDPEQIKFLTQNIQMEQNAVIEKLRTQFKSIIISEEEYRQVIDQNDPLFQEIVHPSNCFGLDEDQELYLEKQIDKFQKTKFLEWLSKCQHLCKEELLKHQQIEEYELTQQFEILQVKIQETIKNKIQQLDQSKTLMEQFQAKWMEDEWQEKVINIQNTLLKLINENSIFSNVIDFRCRSQQITDFLARKNIKVVLDDKYKFGTITLDRKRSIDFETYFQLVVIYYFHQQNNKILFFAYDDLRKIVILMFEFVTKLFQANLNLNVNYDWKQMIIQLDQDGQFEGVILLNLQEEVSQNIIIFATIVFQLGDRLNLSYEDRGKLQFLVGELSRNNKNNVQMAIENNYKNYNSNTWYETHKKNNSEKLNTQINIAITTFNNNKPKNIQDTLLDIRCKLQINNAQFMKILLDPFTNVKYKQNGNTNYLIKEEQSPLFESLLYELIDRLKQRCQAIESQLDQNLKDKGEFQQWFKDLQNRQKLDEFILQYLQMIGLFNQTNFEIEIEVIVIQFQIHIQQYLQTYYLSKEQLPTLYGYLEKVVILECIESSCILTECIFESKLFELQQSIDKLKNNTDFRLIKCVDDDFLKLFKKYSLTQRETLQDYFEKTNPKDILDQLSNIIMEQQLQNECNNNPLINDEFKNYCFQEFNKIINDTYQVHQPLNLETLNLNVKDALYYATNQYQLLRLKIGDQYQNDVTSIYLEQIETMFYERFYKGWKEGMDNHQMDELLNLQVFEQQIHSEIKFNRIVNAFIEFSSQEGHYYLFDEEYQQIHQNLKIQEILNQNSLPFKLSYEQYQEILNQLKFDQVIELVKKLLIDQIKIPKEFSKNHYFNGKALQFLFNHVRNSVQKDKGNCSFYELLSLSLSSENLIKMLFEQFPQDPNVMTAIRKEYDSSLTLTRQKIKHHIPSEEEYLKVIDESDPLFLEIVRPSDNFDQAQIVYLENQIDKFQKAYFQQLLIQRWKTYKQETQKHQEINEEEWERIFQTLQKKIEQSIGNKLNQLEVGKPLVDTFRKQWINIWDPKIIVAFIDVSEE